MRSAGLDVAIATPDFIPGNELSRSGDLAPANVRLQSSGIQIIKRALLRKVDNGFAVIEDRFTGEPRSVPAAVVVDAGHRLPDDRLWRETGQRLPRAGDAVRAPHHPRGHPPRGRHAGAASKLVVPAPPGTGMTAARGGVPVTVVQAATATCSRPSGWDRSCCATASSCSPLISHQPHAVDGKPSEQHAAYCAARAAERLRADHH